MSDAAEPPESEADAWATACEEDLAAEKARRRAEYGQQPVNPAEDLRRLADAVSEKVAELGKPFAGTVASAAAQGVAQQFIAQARAAIEPVVERNPNVFDHLTAAGGELLAAYRAAVQDAEGRWTAGDPGSADRAGPADPGIPAVSGGRPDTAGPGGVERIDLDKDPAESAERGSSAEPDRQDGDRQDGAGGADGPGGSAAPGDPDQQDGPEGPGGRGGSGTGSQE